MEKPSLMQRLASVRRKAEAAHLEIVIGSRLVTQLEREGRDGKEARLRLRTWKMTEQKLLRELDWILDKLDQPNDGRKASGRN
jgi:hypothetical protein